MPPKKTDKQPAKSTKVAVDKTFGMKNKKGAQAQKIVAQIKDQVAQAQTPEQKRKAAEKAQKEKEKAAAEQAKRETAELFKPVQVQKVPFGVDPKTVLCIFHKQGNCEKGRKCKFSHDLNIERKGAKKDLYQDTREGDKEKQEEERKKDDMADWDEAKLQQVILSKHGNPKTTTDKVCKYFVAAVEDGKYGWFWTCPNGGDKCMYRHSLPPGFILKTREQRAAEKALMDKSPLKTLTLEDFLESERHKLTGTLTPVTPETFAKWKKERLDKKAAEEQARQAKEATGRAMFEEGGWQDSEDEDESEVEEEAGDDGDEDVEQGEGGREPDQDQVNGNDHQDNPRHAMRRGNHNDNDASQDWDMAQLRQETERLRDEEERRRIERLGGGQAVIEADKSDWKLGEEGDHAIGVVEKATMNGH